MVKSGEQSVMTLGMIQTLLLSAGNSASLRLVRSCIQYYVIEAVLCTYMLLLCTGAQALSFAAYGQGTGPILLDDVACAGTEARLIECRASPITTHNCVHFEDASVRCQPPPSEYNNYDCAYIYDDISPIIK